MSKAFSTNAKIDKNLCNGCASCSILEDAVFEFDENLQQSVVKENPEDVGEERLVGVAQACPTLAIFVEDAQKKKIYPKDDE